MFLPSGESHKRLATVESLAQQLALAGADRDSILLAFGGGVIGDVTGFLAAIYMRGIRYVGLPTTLLAQVDSSLGGKTGVNLLAGKNLIGAFHHPLAVFSDIDLLATLPAAELRAGLQEAIKSGIIRDAKLFRYMEQNAEYYSSRGQSRMHSLASSPPASASRPRSSARTRRNPACAWSSTSATPSATPSRPPPTTANSCTAKRSPGACIAALHVSLNRGLITPEDFARMANLILRYGPIPPFKIAATPQASAAKLVALTSADKKKRSGRRAFVLATGIGRTEVAHDVTDAELLAATHAMLNTMQQVER